MLTTIVAATILAVAPPVDFQLKYKVGDRFTYVHRFVSPVLGVDATGDAVLTVDSVKNGVTTLSSAQVNYKVAKGRFQPTPAGKIDLQKNGRPTEKATESPLVLFFNFGFLPEKPISLGETYDFQITDQGVTMSFKGTFESLKDNIATLQINGGKKDPSTGESYLKATVKFDVKRGIYTLIHTDMGGGNSVISFMLKPMKA